YAGYSLPQVLRMLEVHARDHGDEAVHDIRRIHPPPHPHLDHSDVHLPLVEVLEGHRGRDLEERRMVDRPGGGHRSNRRLHPRPKAQDIVIRNRSAVHLDPLVEADEVWGRVQADAIAGFLKDGGRVCAHGTLAVRAGDVKDLQAAVGIPQQGKKPSDVVQAQLDPEPLETIEVLKGRVVIHRSGRANGPRGLKVARSRTEESNEAHTYISRMAIVHRMHPAERLRGRKSPKLHGKTIVLGVTGSIAAVETVKLAHELIRHGADVHAVLTRSALEIVHPNALEYATGHAVVTAITGSLEYLEMCGRDGKADLLLIAPCTANTMGKIAQGIDDTTVTTYATNALGSGIPILLAPAAHESMIDNPAVAANVRRLRELGIEFVDPRRDEDKAKMADVDTIVARAPRGAGPTLASLQVVRDDGRPGQHGREDGCGHLCRASCRRRLQSGEEADGKNPEPQRDAHPGPRAHPQTAWAIPQGHTE